MRIRIVRILPALGFGAIPIALWAFSTGPPISRTGAPADGGQACNVCHTTFPLNDDSGGSIVIRASAYTPGVKQLIEVQISHPTAVRFGFQLTARTVSDETKQAGTFTKDDNTRVRCAPAGTDGPCDGALEFVSHVAVSTNAANPGPRTFLIEWTPPATDVGPIVMYAAGNAANNNGNNQGDHIYTTKATITPAGATQSGVLNTISSALSIAPNTWVTILGTRLATGTRLWTNADIVAGKLPTQLDGTSVKINGKDAFVYSISPTQVTVLTPLDDTVGPVPVQVTAGGTVAATMMAQLSPYSPGFFASKDNSLVAQHADFSLVGPASPAKPGETIVLYGTGFGQTTPDLPSGQIPSGIANLANPIKIRVGGVDVEPSFSGLTATGLYQFNVPIPDSAADGNIPVVATIGGFSSPGTVFIPVKK
jgi:uncharacterized protein (TIGR03437 family)